MKKFQVIEIRDRLHTSYNYNKVSCPDGARSVNNRQRDETPAIFRSMCTATAGDGSDAPEIKALFSFKYLVGNSRYCCRASARQHTILDLLKFLQSSFDPGFCAHLCIVEISICFCLSVRPERFFPGE